MAIFTYVCPYCGRVFTRNTSGAAATAVLSRNSPTCGTAAAQTASTCTIPQAIPQQLYGTPRLSAITQTCIDAYGESTRLTSRRNAFWPSFARPRWLTCNELYS